MVTQYIPRTSLSVTFLALVMLGAAATQLYKQQQISTTTSSPLRQERCAVYSHERCVFDPTDNLGEKKCKPTVCEFDKGIEFACAFSETGSFITTSADACSDPFMSVRRQGASSCSTGRCCSADLGGEYLSNGTLPTGASRYVFQPTSPAKCRYAEMTRGQVLHLLESAGGGGLLTVFGDSMLRQAFLRLVLMLRGQHRLLDFAVHTNSQYFTCDEADAFRISDVAYRIADPTDTSAHNPDMLNQTSYVESSMLPFFRMQQGPGRIAARQSLSRCSRPPVELQYIFSPRFDQQATALRVYADSLLAEKAPFPATGKLTTPGRRPVVVVGIHYWEGLPEIPEDYLEALLNLKSKAKKIVVIGIATGYVPENDDYQVRRKGYYHERNQFMKKWVAEQGAPFLFVDYDALSSPTLDPRPAGPMKNDKHWMCRLGWLLFDFPKLVVDNSSSGVNAVGVPMYQVSRPLVEKIFVADDAQCADETNRNLWQLILNAIVPERIL